MFNPEETENNSPPVGLSKQCILHDDKERCWLLLRPAIIPFGGTPPLVIDMHGGGDDVYQGVEGGACLMATCGCRVDKYEYGDKCVQAEGGGEEEGGGSRGEEEEQPRR